MSERACILRLDRTTANGTVLDGIEDVGPDERGMSYIGARVQCPACGSIGHIAANGPRAEEDAMDGRPPALEEDYCRCRSRVRTSPKLKCSHSDARNRSIYNLTRKATQG